MDPNRDSIIYRMTSQRMKRDWASVSVVVLTQHVCSLAVLVADVHQRHTTHILKSSWEIFLVFF